MSQKFLFIFRGGFYDGLSADEAQKQMGRWFAWIEKLQAAGVYHGGEPLAQGGKTLSKKGSDIVVDGPFAESKESVAGYFLVEAGSMEKAAEMAKDYPDFHLGGKVEVREVMKVEMPA